MKYDYDSLLVLANVIRTGSFEAAAKSLGVTQSAVSQRIRQLEEKIGSVLVVRGRPCTATEDGLLLCQHAEQVSILEHELSEQLALHGGGEARVAAAIVRIAVNADSLATWFPDVVLRAESELNLRLEVLPDDQEFTEERLRSGDALAIVTAHENPIPGCQISALGSMDYMAVASPEFFERHFGDGVSLPALAAAPSIRFDRKDTLPQQWLMLAFGSTAKLTSHFIPSYEGHLASSLKSAGWAMMPSVTVGPLVENGALRELLPGVFVSIRLYWQTRSQSSNTLQSLSQIVSDVAASQLEPAS